MYEDRGVHVEMVGKDRVGLCAEMKNNRNRVSGYLFTEPCKPTRRVRKRGEMPNRNRRCNVGVDRIGPCHVHMEKPIADVSCLRRRSIS